MVVKFIDKNDCNKLIKIMEVEYMSVKWEKQEGNTGILTVEVDVAIVKDGLDKAFKKVVKEINVPGFRKGKMPRKMFEQRFGTESLYQDALDFILPDAYSGAVEEAAIDPVDRPEIDIVKMEQGENLIFTATVTVRPEVTLGDYKGLEISKQETDVTDEEIEAQIKEQQTRLAELVVKEEDAIVDGDTAVIDFEGFLGEEAFEGGAGEDHTLEIGSGSFIPGFEEQLIGSKAGDNKEVVVTFPEEYHAAELAGKEATFKVTVKEVKGKELPELNDELAKEIDNEVESMDELRTKLKEKTVVEKKNAAESKVKDELVELAANNATIDIPQAMVDMEVERMLNDFKQRLESQGMNLELYFQFSGQDEKALRTQMTEDGQKRVKVSLTLEAIAEAEGFTPSEEEINSELEKMAVQFSMPAEKIRESLGGTDALENDLRLQKAIDFLVENAKVS